MDPGRGCSASGSEDDPVIVSGHRKRAQVKSGSESSDSGREGGKRRKKYRKPECDEEIRYHNAQYLHDDVINMMSSYTLAYYSYNTVLTTTPRTQPNISRSKGSDAVASLLIQILLGRIWTAFMSYCPSVKTC